MAVAGPVRAKSIAAYDVAWAHRAVLLVDIVEFVRLVEEDEVGVISRWLRLVGEVTTQILPRCGGRLVKSLGDGMLLDFEDVRAAVWAALAIRCASERENEGCPRAADAAPHGAGASATSSCRKATSSATASISRRG